MMDMHASSPFFIPSVAAGEALPGGLRQALEFLSGLDMSDVRVHYRSAWPARIGAQAFAFGSEIHLGPQAEAALAHEAWHVVQQKQGRVAANARVAGSALNDEPALEREADWMGGLSLVLARCRRLPDQGRHLPRRVVQQPLLQCALTIDQTVFENVDELPDSTIKGNRALLVEVQKRLRTAIGANRNYSFPDQILVDIVADLQREKNNFATWDACLREIAIRNVGYQAEAKMRALMKENNLIVEDQKKGFEARKAEAKKKLAEDLLAAGTDEEKKENANRECNDKLYTIAAEEREADGFLKWTNPSYFPASVEFDMAAWVLGFTNIVPARMNCWEAVLFSLVMSGAADKSYITWANRTIELSRQPNWSKNSGSKICPNFLEAALRNVEKYWYVSQDRLGIESKKQELGQEWRDKTMVRLPPELVIPRGRVVIMNFGSHVALSTGRNVRIESEDARKFFATQTGHGILELDKAENGSETIRSIRETTIEDLMSNGPIYLKHIAYAPFPHTMTPNKFNVDKSVNPKTLLSVEEAVQKFLEENEGQIQVDIDKATQRNTATLVKLREKIDPTSKNYEQDENRRNDVATKIGMLDKQNNGLEKNVRDKWRASAMKSDSVKTAIGEWGEMRNGKVKFPVVFSWDALDIYYGLASVI